MSQTPEGPQGPQTPRGPQEPQEPQGPQAPGAAGPAMPPAAGWYSMGGDPENLAYFDGTRWTWRGRRDEHGVWRQEPLAMPGPAQPASSGAPGSPFAAAYRPIGRVDLLLGEPQRQARWKTLLRAVLVIPNLVALGLLMVAVGVVTVLMWFAALFTARVPEGMWRFSAGALAWQARTYGYVYLLTDRYPPFETGEVAYPVTVTLDGPPERYNRWAVVFRAVLVVPAWVVTASFTWGVALVALAAWVATLVAGKCPRPLHLVLAASLRYSLRTSAYLYLLTTEYPGGALGDKGAGHGSLDTGLIVLRGASRAVAVAAIALGALAYLASVVTTPLATTTTAKQRAAIVEWDALSSRAAAAQVSFRSQFQVCRTSLPCVERAGSILERSLETQIVSVGAIDFPTSATQADASRMISLLRRERSDVVASETASTAQSYRADLQRAAAITTRLLRPLVAELVGRLGSTA